MHIDENSLKSHRDAIDTIDAQVLRLLNERAQHARAIGTLKGTGAVYRPEREAQVLQRIRALNTGPLSDESAARLMREVMSECLSLERPLTVCYLGPEGTFTQQAAVKHFGHAAHTRACASIDEAFRNVEAHQADYVVAPVENSTEGAVGRSLDLLVSTPLSACGEVILRIHHNLLAKPAENGSRNIQKIYAHAQALAQCHEWLNKNIAPEIKRLPVFSNAEAARMAAQDSEAAAIAGVSAAEKYGLEKIAVNIEDEPNNTTRFLILGRENPAASGRDKTSLVVSVPNKAGAIHDLLQPFADYKVSMTKLESRPSRGGLWEYVFFIDIEGHRSEENIQAALNALHERAAFMKIVGSYPLAVL